MNRDYLLRSLLLLLILLSSCCSTRDPISYVALGASDAVGIGASTKEHGYAYLIQKSLDATCQPTILINPAESGAKITTINTKQLPIALSMQADFLSIWTGVNDLVAGVSVTSFEEHLEHLMSCLQRSSTGHVFIANIPDLTRLPRFIKKKDPDVTVKRIAAYNNVIKHISRHFHAILIDIHSITLENDLISEDGFHPNDKGHRYIAEAFLNHMKSPVCKNTGQNLVLQ